jgi:3-methyladenine DNA glycosylase Mpg
MNASRSFSGFSGRVKVFFTSNARFLEHFVYGCGQTLNFSANSLKYQSGRSSSKRAGSFLFIRSGV